MLPYLPMMDVKQESGILCGISPHLNVDRDVKIGETLYCQYCEVKQNLFTVFDIQRPEVCYPYSSKKAKNANTRNTT